MSEFGAERRSDLPAMAGQGRLDRYFGLTRSGTTIRTEIIAGATTFLTMAYIVFVNPTILGQAGMDKGAVFVATCLAVVTATTMPLTYSIATGIGLGFIVYALIKIISGRLRDASPAVIALAALFALKFAVTG